jgi:hypothetical protein
MVLKVFPTAGIPMMTKWVENNATNCFAPFINAR